MLRCYPFFAAVSLSLLAACSNGSTSTPQVIQQPPPPKRYTSQTLNWTSCPINFFGEDEESKRHWNELGNRLQCAVMTVPRDWNNPEKNIDIKVQLSRVLGTDKTNRKGILLWILGGPGGTGVEMPVNFGYAWSKANPEQDLGQKFQRLAAEYDMIGYDPRGVGRSCHTHL